MPRFSRQGADEPREFYKPALPASYAFRLGYIGKQLDEAKVRSVTIVEISGNFIIRCIERRSDTMMISEMVAEDFANADYSRSRGIDPASYEAMLRVLGEDLDESVAANVAIMERSRSFEVVGWAHGSAAGISTYVPTSMSYPRAELQIWASQNP